MSNDETQPVSGSRWEQEPDQPATEPAATEPAASAPAAAPAYAPAPLPRSGNRSKLLLAGGTLGIALVAGTGGFALGHVTADDGHDGPGRFGFMHDGGPQGAFPGQGQPPGGFPEGDEDGSDLPDGQDQPDVEQGTPNT